MSQGPYLVVDASVALKWALDDEEAVAQAVALRDAGIRGEFQMLAPSLWLYEVSNGLVMAVRRRRLTPQRGTQALQHILVLGVRLADPETDDVHKYAIRYGLTTYDAAYLALAQALDIPLWTGDQRFYEATQELVDRIRWIGDYSEGG